MSLPEIARQVTSELARRQQQVVFAESCTAGLVSATLATIPGVSEWLCGSAVTYQSATKTAWLGVPAELIAAETAVSAAVAQAMAEGVLKKTPQADLAASITGHLGPEAPQGFDGLVFVAVAQRQADQITVQSERYQLAATGRRARQEEAAELVLRQLLRTRGVD